MLIRDTYIKMIAFILIQKKKQHLTLITVFGSKSKAWTALMAYFSARIRHFFQKREIQNLDSWKYRNIYENKIQVAYCRSNSKWAMV